MTFAVIRIVTMTEKLQRLLFVFRLVFLGDPNIEITNRGQVLRIKSARLGDKARYQCSVMNIAGKQSKDFNLSVYGECVHFKGSLTARVK